MRAEATHIKDRWLPALRTMVADISGRFSALFSRLGCVGEVQLTERGEDYDEWELNILVQFREQSQLAQLSVQRQSGGERSVTTILFLLSLQEMAASPFRVVDEINQGMDAANERRMHSLLVATATAAPQQRSQLRSQYFLITPKLLTGLEYHERMHVHCVFNGPGVLI